MPVLPVVMGPCLLIIFIVYIVPAFLKKLGEKVWMDLNEVQTQGRDERMQDYMYPSTEQLWWKRKARRLPYTTCAKSSQKI